MPASHRAEDPRIPGPDSPELPSPLAAAALSLQSLPCCSEAKCKDQRGERKAQKGGAPGASRVHSKQIFKAGKCSQSNSSDLLTAQTGSDACSGKVATAAAGAGVSPSAWAPTLPSPPLPRLALGDRESPAWPCLVPCGPHPGWADGGWGGGSKQGVFRSSPESWEHSPFPTPPLVSTAGGISCISLGWGGRQSFPVGGPSKALPRDGVKGLGSGKGPSPSFWLQTKNHLLPWSTPTTAPGSLPSPQ